MIAFIAIACLICLAVGFLQGFESGYKVGHTEGFQDACNKVIEGIEKLPSVDERV